MDNTQIPAQPARVIAGNVPSEIYDKLEFPMPLRDNDIILIAWMPPRILSIERDGIKIWDRAIDG
jgi:hypothetical protein